MATSMRIEGSMGATRCGTCCRTTEYHVASERRVRAGALAIGRRWLARCSACGHETELTPTAARAAIRRVSSCHLRPALRAA